MGLMRGVARTAVIAGTATAVSNRVSRRQQNRWAAQQAPPQDAYYQQAPPPAAYQQAPPAAYQAAAPPAPGAETTDPYTQLLELAELKQQGVLTEAEFQVEKAKILGN